MNKEILKYIVPVVAVLVVAESIVLVSKLTNKNPATNGQTGGQVVVVKEPTDDVPDTTVKDNREPVFDVVFGTSNKSLVIGKAQTIEVNLVSRGDYNLDALSVYVKYDPNSFDATNLTYDAKLPKPIIIKASTKKNLVVANFMVAETSGLKLKKGDTISLLKFDVTPKKEGTFTFDLSTSNDSKESATMFVETATSKDLPFSSNKLTVSVTK